MNGSGAADAVNHLPIASMSSVYGGNKDTPFAETQKAIMLQSICAAIKKAIEVVTGL